MGVSRVRTAYGPQIWGAPRAFGEGSSAKNSHAGEKGRHISGAEAYAVVLRRAGLFAAGWKPDRYVSQGPRGVGGGDTRIVVSSGQLFGPAHREGADTLLPVSASATLIVAGSFGLCPPQAISSATRLSPIDLNRIPSAASLQSQAQRLSALPQKTAQFANLYAC
jgi:hypothetical protein